MLAHLGLSRARHRPVGNIGGRTRDDKRSRRSRRKATTKRNWTTTKAPTKTTKKLTRQIVLEYMDEMSCHFLHAFCHGSILTHCGCVCNSYRDIVSGFRDSNKGGSSAGEGRGKRSNGRLRISEAMKGTSLFCFSLHTDAFDLLNVGFNFHSRPSHDVFGIGLCQKSDDCCHDELLCGDLRKDCRHSSPIPNCLSRRFSAFGEAQESERV